MSQFPAQNARASLKLRRLLVSVISAPEFPAQNARASLKLRPPELPGAVPQEFPAQNARASLKHEVRRFRRHHVWVISRAKRAGLIEAGGVRGRRPRRSAISRAKRAGLIEAQTTTTSDTVYSEFPAQNARASLKLRTAQAHLRVRRNFPRKTRGPH